MLISFVEIVTKVLGGRGKELGDKASPPHRAKRPAKSLTKRTAGIRPITERYRLHWSF